MVKSMKCVLASVGKKGADWVRESAGSYGPCIYGQGAIRQDSFPPCYPILLALPLCLGKHPLPCTAYLHIHLCTLLALLAPQLDDALPGVLRASIQIAVISQAYWRPGHYTQPLALTCSSSFL